MITASGEDKELKLKALEAGVTEFLTKPIDSIEFKLRTKTLLDLRIAQKLLQDEAALLEVEVAQATQTIISREKETLKILAKVSVSRDAEIHLLKDEKGHSFDPEIVDIFLKNMDSIMEIYDTYRSS